MKVKKSKIMEEIMCNGTKNKQIEHDFAQMNKSYR